jgi:hypothetical protein
MRTRASIIQVLWSLFWRAMIFAVPAFIGTTILAVILLIVPFWAVLMWYFGKWAVACGALVLWLAAVSSLHYFLKRTQHHPLGRYRDGAV